MRQMKKVASTTIAAALAVTSTLVLSSCSGAGPNAETRMTTQVTDGAEAVIKSESADIRVSNFLLVATGDGNSVVVGHIVNRAAQADEIDSISIAGISAQLTGTTTLTTNVPVIFEGTAATAKAVLVGANLAAGTNARVTIVFKKAGVVTVNAIVRDTSDLYAGVTSGAKLVSPTPAPSN